MHLYDPFHHLIKAGEQGAPYPLLWALLVSNPPAKKDPNISPYFTGHLGDVLQEAESRGKCTVPAVCPPCRQPVPGEI